MMLLKLILAFQGELVCVILGCFVNFSGDPLLLTTTVVHDILYLNEQIH